MQFESEIRHTKYICKGKYTQLLFSMEETCKEIYIKKNAYKNYAESGLEKTRNKKDTTIKLD